MNEWIFVHVVVGGFASLCIALMTSMFSSSKHWPFSSFFVPGRHFVFNWSAAALIFGIVWENSKNIWYKERYFMAQSKVPWCNYILISFISGSVWYIVFCPNCFPSRIYGIRFIILLDSFSISNYLCFKYINKMLRGPLSMALVMSHFANTLVKVEIFL